MTEVSLKNNEGRAEYDNWRTENVESVQQQLAKEQVKRLVRSGSFS